jgi:serine/threonine protein kinase
MLDNLSNSQIGDFVLQEMIGRRAAMALYRSTQQSLKRFAVLKIIDVKSVPLPREALEDDFVTFTRNIVALEHMHLQPIYDFGLVDEQYIYIAARFMAGNLYELLKTGPLPVEQTLELALQIALALMFIHSNGLIHSSLSPRNVYIDEMSNAYIDDLELSRLIQAARTQKELQSLLDEPFYTSVEQLELQPLNAQTEMYNFGAIVYHMLTGIVPFSDGDQHFEAVLARKQRNQIVPPRHINPAISPTIEKVILRTLRANPEERFSDFQTLESALRLELNLIKPGDLTMMDKVRGVLLRIRPKPRFMQLH